MDRYLATFSVMDLLVLVLCTILGEQNNTAYFCLKKLTLLHFLDKKAL